LDKIRRMLKEGPKTWQQFRNAVDTSPSTLSGYLSYLMKMGELKTYSDAQDRRITWYEEIEEKMESERKRTESLVFIENIEEPMVIFERGEEGISGVSLFISSVVKGREKLLEPQFRNFAKASLRQFEKLLFNLKPGYKIAMILTKEK